MSRRGRTPKMGVFTGHQFANLQSIGHQARRKLLLKRWRGMTIKSEDLMPLFVEEKHHGLCLEAAKLAKPTGRYNLGITAFAKYGDFTPKVTLTATIMDPPFRVPDYANMSVTSPSGHSKKLPPDMQRYVDGRLSLAIEFGLLDAMLNWFANERLYIPQMAYLFPPIIQMLSQSPVTKELAEKHSGARSAMPNYVPPPPGLREAFSIVEATVMKVLMMWDEDVKDIATEIDLDVRFPEPDIKFMGWDINLH